MTATFKHPTPPCKADTGMQPRYMRRSREDQAAMTGTTRSSSNLDQRRRKALFRSWHRGIREMDLVLGAFADSSIADLTASELDQYEALMDVPDADLLNWVTGQAQLPPQYDTSVFRRILASSRATPVQDS